MHTHRLITTIKLVMNIEYFILIISEVSVRGDLQDHMTVVNRLPRASVIKIYDIL